MDRRNKRVFGIAVIGDRFTCKLDLATKECREVAGICQLNACENH